MEIIRFDGPGHYPELIRSGEAFCVRCGHCVATCSHVAMDYAEVPLAQCPDIDPALTISPTQAEQFLRSHRSVRRFKDKPIEQELLQRLIETARYAPTASHAQPLAWRVINNPQWVQTIAGEVIGWMRGQVADPKATVVPFNNGTQAASWHSRRLPLSLPRYDRLCQNALLPPAAAQGAQD